MSHREAVPADFVGKTITACDVEACNIWRFQFSDGSVFAVEAEDYGMVICDECGEGSFEQAEAPEDQPS